MVERKLPLGSQFLEFLWDLWGVCIRDPQIVGFPYHKDPSKVPRISLQAPHVLTD